jgi:hypothetical protein
VQRPTHLAEAGDVLSSSCTVGPRCGSFFIRSALFRRSSFLKFGGGKVVTVIAFFMASS